MCRRPNGGQKTGLPIEISVWTRQGIIVFVADFKTGAIFRTRLETELRRSPFLSGAQHRGANKAFV